MNEEGKEYRKEEDYSCGYAPRVLCRLPRPEKFAKVLFVGAKDGSVTVLLQEKRDDQKFQSFHLPCTETGKYCAPVRVLLEWGQDRLLVGRDDGRIDVIRWRDAIRKRKNGRSELFPPPRTKNGDNESVRYATWLGENQLLVSYRHAGTGLYNLDETLRHVPEQFQSVGETKRLGGIRLAARIESSRDLVLIDSKGKLWHWSPNLDWEKPPREIVGWKEDAPPATFDDVTYVGHEDDTGRKAIRALILATDTGVFALDLRERSWQQRLKPQPVRLALPGSRLFCMAVTYVQSGQNCHLWLTNRQGESFLFENEPLQKQPLESWALGFRNSRLFHAEAQALTATSWPDGDRIWLARACRDDRIRIYSYAIEPPMLGQAERVQLLQASCKPARFDEVENALKRIRKSLNLEDQIWPGYALLAEYIEAQVENDSDQFFEFLSRPSSDLAVAILTHDTQKSHDPSEAEKTIKSAVKLWNFCLIGAAHRQSNPKEEWYLGILRFLRGLEFASFQDDPKGDLRACLSNSVDQAIRFARKWGLYGEVNEIRQNLVRPLAIYRRNQEVSGKLLDKLTYSSLLFRRSFSEVCQDRSAHGEGNHAWAIKALPLDDITIIAVSWRRKGIALFVVDSPKELSEVRLSEVKLPEELGGLRDDGADQYAYSRDLLLMRDSSVPKGFILLTSKRQTQDSTWTEEVKCWTCKLKNEGSTWILESPTPAKLQGLKEDYRGSAYRFLDISREELGVRHVLVGLEGREGRAELAELKIEISTNGTVLTVEAPHSLGKGIQSANEESRTEVPRTVQRNRVWSLAKTKSGFVAGSDNGEIWHVPLDPESKPTRVGKLASAVTALAANDVGGKIRVYAGSRDGTLIAFQEVTLNTTPRKQSFTTLWATVEKSEITYIGRHKYRDGKENFDLVLAIVQNGMCIAFDDSKKMKAFEARDNDDSKHPQRPPFPGIRWLRTGTDRKCFAAVSLPSKSKGGNWGLLALASEDGQLDLLSLHYPRYTERRKAEFSQHFEDLWNVAKEGVEDGQPENLRVIEATYRSAPLIPLIVVRLLLDPSRESENTKHLEKLALWWFPKFLRPLREFRTDWEAALTKTGELSKEASERVKQALETVLETAWRRRDVDLFQEVCALALKRSNFMLCEPGEHSVDSMKNLYFAIFDTIRNALQKWLGSELDKEARARIIVAKNLVDGDTAYRLFSILQQPDEQNRDAWQGILRRRIDGVRQLVWKGNLIVSLESLRAANHSLLRTCRRLSDERKQKGDGLTAIQWVFFKEYFLQLVAGAVQALGSNLRLRDALTHEYARTFALCLSACPEGAVQMTALLAETRLIVDPRSEDDLATRIESQLTVLKDTFCIGVHCWIEFVFASALRPDLDNLLQEPPGLQEKWWSEQPAGILRNDWKEVKNLYAFVTGLDRFASELAGADRERSQYEFKTLAELKKIANEGLESQIFRHSWRFWNDALQEEDKLKAIQTPPFQARIRPDVVLSSRDLAAWADKWAEKLEERYREAQIFQPEYGLFKEVLDRLRRAALAFPKGAAVQKNLVVGILGHHLLEDLDLHVLDLREIARNLDPLSVDADDDEDEGSESGISTKEREDQRRSIESDFAALLVRREKGARSLPKNLRTLAKVLNPEEPEEDRGPNGEGLRGFLEEFCKSSSRNWGNPEWKGGEVAINSRERELLRLVLDELDQNHQHHSGFEGKRLKEEKPKVLWEGQELVMRFPVAVDSEGGKERWQRLSQACRLGGQALCVPNRGGKAPSSGVGLYLSCLAASMVGWEVSLRREPDRDDAGKEAQLLVRMRPLSPKKIRGEMDQSKAQLEKPEGHPGQKVNVVVIDDKIEVALYTWRELGGVPGFGSAEDEGAKARKIFELPKPIETPDQEIAVWWVPAEGDFRKRLSRVIRRLPQETVVYFLVDVRGPVGSAQDGARVYKWENAVKQIRRTSSDVYPERIRLISSYEHGIRTLDAYPFEIHDKSPRTFSKLREEFLGSHRTESKEENDTIHILVTGAGFEMREEPEEQRLGTPGTWDLLERWIKNFYGENKLKQTKGFSIPADLDDIRWQKLRNAAEASNLDEYWTYLLEAERERTEGDGLAKAQREYELRESFRREFVRFDWGYLPQAIAAARLRWSVWLSTNYTRFADRALERASRLAKEQEFCPWRTIEVSEEAERLSRQVLHDGGRSNLDKERILVKLHGDISHVLTMAIAGEDKSFLSRLSSFAPLYLAAQAALAKRALKATKITWHIVGHGLRDELLLRVIETVYRVKPKKHRFVVVDPAKGGEDPQSLDEHPGYRLARKLGNLGNNKNPLSIIDARCATAGLYLTKLERQGLASFETVLANLDRPTGWPVGQERSS